LAKVKRKREIERKY